MELSAEDQAALDAARGEFDSLTAQHESAEELPDEVDARFGELEAEIERLEAKRQAYDPADIARYWVCLSEIKLARTDDEVRREMA